jgi:hypothetical protein
MVGTRSDFRWRLVEPVATIGPEDSYAPGSTVVGAITLGVPYLSPRQIKTRPTHSQQQMLARNDLFERAGDEVFRPVQLFAGDRERCSGSKDSLKNWTGRIP